MEPLPQAISNHTRGCLSLDVSTSHFYCLLLLERGIQEYIFYGMKSVFYPKSLKKTFQCPLLMFSWLVNRGGVKLWGREHSLRKDTCTLSHNTQSASTFILWALAHRIKDWAAGEGTWLTVVPLDVVPEGLSGGTSWLYGHCGHSGQYLRYTGWSGDLQLRINKPREQRQQHSILETLQEKILSN